MNRTTKKGSKEKRMKNNTQGYIISKLTPPKFDKHPLVAIEIGCETFGPFYERGPNYVTYGLFGVYISFRKSWDPEEAWRLGIEDGFKASTKSIGVLLQRIAVRESIIKKMSAISGIEFVSDDPNDPFAPSGTLIEPNDDEDDDDNGFNFDPSLN